MYCGKDQGMLPVFKCAYLVGWLVFYQKERKAIVLVQTKALSVTPVETKDDADFPALNHFQLLF